MSQVELMVRLVLSLAYRRWRSRHDCEDCAASALAIVWREIRLRLMEAVDGDGDAPESVREVAGILGDHATTTDGIEALHDACGRAFARWFRRATFSVWNHARRNVDDDSGRVEYERPRGYVDCLDRPERLREAMRCELPLPVDFATFWIAEPDALQSEWRYVPCHGAWSGLRSKRSAAMRGDWRDDVFARRWYRRPRVRACQLVNAVRPVDSWRDPALPVYDVYDCADQSVPRGSNVDSRRINWNADSVFVVLVGRRPGRAVPQVESEPVDVQALASASQETLRRMLAARKQNAGA